MAYRVTRECRPALFTFLALLIGLLTGLPQPASAQNPEFFTPPSGWTATTGSLGWSVESPAYTEGKITFIMPVVTTYTGDFAESFANEVPGIMADAFGPISESSNVENITKLLGPDPVLKSTHLIQAENGKIARVEVIGYPVSEGAQLMFIVSPLEIHVASSPMVTLHDWALGISSQNFALTEERLARAIAYETGGGGTPSDDSTGTTTTAGQPKCRIERRLVDTSRYEQYNCVLYSGSFIPICQTRYVPGMEYRDEHVCD